MDLGAYVQIGDLQAVADANGISIHRLRGYRLMVEQEPYSEEELQDGLDEMISAEELMRNRELCQKYPFLHPYQALVETDDEDFLPRTDSVSPDFDYSYTMLDFVPAGWKHLFLEMCEEIRQELTGTDEFYRIRFFEIKEKYGSLRLAATGGNRVTDAIIDQCEKDSQRICVQCGKPATRISQGWICPFCGDCIGDRASVAIE